MALQLGEYADELRSKNAQLEADFNMAREIQQIFLPHQYPTFPPGVPARQSELRFSHRYLPAAAVGAVRRGRRTLSNGNQPEHSRDFAPNAGPLFGDRVLPGC